MLLTSRLTCRSLRYVVWLRSLDRDLSLGLPRSLPSGSGSVAGGGIHPGQTPHTLLREGLECGSTNGSHYVIRSDQFERLSHAFLEGFPLLSSLEEVRPRFG